MKKKTTKRKKKIELKTVEELNADVAFLLHEFVQAMKYVIPAHEDHRLHDKIEDVLFRRKGPVTIFPKFK